MTTINHPIEIPDLLRECFARTSIAAVPFTRIYPDVPLTGPMIVWRLVRRWPGKDKKETKRGRLRGMSDSDPDKITMYMGQWQTALFQFDLIHVNEFEADRLMLAFEASIRESQVALSTYGVDNFFFEEQLEDQSLPLNKSCVTRSVRYLATMTVYTPINVARMREITIHVSQTPFNQTLAVEKSTDDFDLVDLHSADVLSINSLENTDDTDNILYLPSDIDYAIEPQTDGTIKIQWTDYGIRPTAGNTFYITHSTISDPVTRIVH